MSWLIWLNSVSSDERYLVKSYEKLFLYFPLVCPLLRFLGNLLNSRGLCTCKEAIRWSFSLLGFYFSDIIWNGEKTWAKDDLYSFNLLMSYTFIKAFLFKNYLYQLFFLVEVNCSIIWIWDTGSSHLLPPVDL